MKISRCDYCGLLVEKSRICKTNFCSRKCFALYRSNKKRIGYIPWNKGKKNVYSERTLSLMRSDKLGKILSAETLEKMSKSHTGEKTNFWKGGINSLSNTIRKNFRGKTWRKAVYARDNWICQECGQRGLKLHAHHITPFAKLLKDFLKEYSYFSPVEDKETLIRLSDNYEPFYNINNGITLCEACHKNTKSYLNGYKS